MSADQAVLAAARAGDERAFSQLINPFRRELRAHCYRMAGSLHDADDLLQESLIRAWRGLPAFEGRSSLRAWLYRVATNACLDVLRSRAARVLPSDLGPPVPGSTHLDATPDVPWLEPLPDDPLDTIAGDAGRTPEAQIGHKQSVAFAFLVALQKLSPKQRAVLLLRDVLGFEASECAELLDTTVASVTSALQRAREAAPSIDTPTPPDAQTATLLRDYVTAWERADVPRLVSLLQKDATLTMPPFSQWLRGADDIGQSIGAMVLRPEAAGHHRLVPVVANARPAFAMYRRSPTGDFTAAAIHVLDLAGDRIAAITAFLDPTLFARFGLPTERSFG